MRRVWCRAALALCLASLAVALPLHGRTGSQAGGRAGEEDTAGGAAERDAKRRTSGYRVDRQRTMGKDRTCSKEEVFGKVSKADAETLFRSIPDPASARKSLGDITRWDHVAGTPNGNLVADYVFDRFTAALDCTEAVITKDAVEVLLTYPESRSLTMLSPVVHEAALAEDILPNDATSDTPWRNKTFLAYSASGTAEAELVYGNFCDPDDFDLLATINVSVSGKIVLCRYGNTFRGLKVMNAQARGAVGVLIYSDPAEDGFKQGEVYPDGPWRPASAVQRGSVQFISKCAGDVARLYSSQSTMDLCGYEPEDLIPKIPVLPLSYGDAEPFLRQLVMLDGAALPKGFQGGLDFAYATGPGPARVKMRVDSPMKKSIISNVVVTIPGSKYGTDEDRWVIMGNHRDAWVFGAADPNSGTAAMLEVARGFGELRRRGWQPERTIVLCSWDGEEWGLLGSTAWGEMHADELAMKAAVYLNVDVGVSGHDFTVAASPALGAIVKNVTSTLEDPARKIPLDQAWGGYVRTLGSGSDYTVFLDRLGVPSVDMSFRTVRAGAAGYGVYHSIYDSFSYVSQIVDPDFAYHTLMATLWGVLALRLADAPILSLSPPDLASALRGYVGNLKGFMGGKGCHGQCSKLHAALAAEDRGLKKIDLTDLETAVATFSKVADSAKLAAEIAKCSSAAGCGTLVQDRVNNALLATERAFLHEPGLPDRKYFRHVLQAPGFYLGYGADTFPGIVQAIRDANWAVAQEQVGVSAVRVAAATKALKSCIWKRLCVHLVDFPE